MWQSCRDRPQDKWITACLDFLCSYCSTICPHTSTKQQRMGKIQVLSGLEERDWVRFTSTCQCLGDSTTLTQWSVLLQSVYSDGKWSQEKFLGQCGSYSQKWTKFRSYPFNEINAIDFYRIITSVFNPQTSVSNTLALVIDPKGENSFLNFSSSMVSSKFLM